MPISNKLLSDSAVMVNQMWFTIMTKHIIGKIDDVIANTSVSSVEGNRRVLVEEMI